MINSIAIAGNLVKDCEVKNFENQDLIKFSIAVSEWSKKGEITHYFDVIYWISSAGKLKDILKKGLKVTLTGSLAQERWENDRKKNSRVVIKAHSLEFMSAKNNASDSEDCPF